MTKVFPADHEYIRRTLRDFRVAEDGQRWVARLRGEGKFRSAVFPELSEKQVLVELIPLSEWKRPTPLLRWLAALRLPYLTISLLPLLLVLSARIGSRAPVPLGLTALLFCSARPT